MKNKISVLLLLSLLFLANTPFTYAHFLGISSVDVGEIRWGGSTTYSTQWNSGISTWNALNPINILPDTIWTVEDLTVIDVNNADLAWYGFWDYTSGADELYLNIYYLASKSSNEKQYTTTHELGHALGLAHSFSGNIMNASLGSQTALGTHDISDYHELWGY